MILTEKHIINKNHRYYHECDKLSFASKNLYNLGLYHVRQYFFENKKYLNYENNYHTIKTTDAYKGLPTKVSCQTLKLIDQAFKSFFGQLKNKELKPKIPKYLDKENGRFVVKFPKQALSLGHLKKHGKIKLSKTEIIIESKIKNYNDLKEVRIVPRKSFYVIEVVYEQIEENNNGTITSAIDPGLNNLSTLTFSDGRTPIIINGRPLKSINQFYNKKLAHHKSKLEKINNKKTSNKIIKLTNKRNNKVNDYLHKSSRLLVNQLVKNDVSTLVIGKNVNQKQDINNGDVNNQNFVQSPIFKFLDIVTYKAKLKGIKVIFQEESYTSKASFLNMDDIPIYGENYEGEYIFSGYRESRGQYKIKKSKIRINADVNGSYNILRKAIPNIFINGIEGFGVIPMVLTPSR